MTTTTEMLNTIGSWLKSQLGIEEIAAIGERLSAIEPLLSQISSNQEQIMATLAEVFSAIESTGTKIIEKVNSETAEVVAALEAAKAGATPEQLQEIIDKVNKLDSSVGDAVSAIIPTVPSPETPTPATEPVPLPSPGQLPPMPNVDVPIEVSESPADVGVDGGAELDLE